KRRDFFLEGHEVRSISVNAVLPRSVSEVSVALLIERTASMICGMSTPDDASESVIRQLMDGRYSEESFRCLFEKYHHAVSSFFFRKGFSSEDRRDLTQEVFVAVHQGIKDLRSEDAFISWLFSIAN